MMISTEVEGSVEETEREGEADPYREIAKEEGYQGYDDPSPNRNLGKWYFLACLQVCLSEKTINKLQLHPPAAI